MLSCAHGIVEKETNWWSPSTRQIKLKQRHPLHCHEQKHCHLNKNPCITHEVDASVYIYIYRDIHIYQKKIYSVYFFFMLLE